MTPEYRQLIDEGYCKFDQILDPAMLRQCHDTCNRLLALAEEEHFRKQRSTGSLIELFQDTSFVDLVTYPPAIDCLRSMGFKDIRWQSGYIISKPPHSPPLFWHQDWWGWDDPSSYDELPPQLFLMYYMVDTNRENGCLRVLPGSHRRAHAVHRLVPDAHTPELQAMKDPNHPAYAVAEGERDVPVRAGDLVVGDARLLHAAHGNSTEQPRPNITIWYHPEFILLPEPIQAHIMERHPFPPEWQSFKETRLKGLVPDYNGPAAPIKPNRIADRFSFGPTG